MKNTRPSLTQCPYCHKIIKSIPYHDKNSPLCRHDRFHQLLVTFRAEMETYSRPTNGGKIHENDN